MSDHGMSENFSSLIPSQDFTSWKGYLPLNMEIIFIEISCPKYPKLENLKVVFPEYEFFNFSTFDLNKEVEKLKEKTHSLPEFLKVLIEILDQILKQDIFSNMQILENITNLKENFYAVIQEINSYDQFIHKIDENINYITFNVLDNSKRQHLLTIYVPDEYPIIKKQPLHFETIVPPIVTNNLLKMYNIIELFEKFKNNIFELNDFWNIHEEIINTCGVIGSYSYKDVNYKIPIDKRVLVNVEIDPFNPKSCPIFDLHGQPEFIEKFQLKLNKIEPSLIWHAEKNFKENILNVFEVDTLQSHYEGNILVNNNAECQNSSNYCLICYGELNIAIKKEIKLCEKCDGIYHMTCICEWMLNSGSTPMFKHLQGKCPQCDEEMLVALENFDLIKK